MVYNSDDNALDDARVAVQRIGAGPEFRVVAHAIVVRIGGGVDADMPEMSHLPIIGDPDAAGVRRDFPDAVIAIINDIDISIGINAKLFDGFELGDRSGPIPITGDAGAGDRVDPAIGSYFSDPITIADKNVGSGIDDRIRIGRRSEEGKQAGTIRERARISIGLSCQQGSRTGDSCLADLV